MSYCYNNNNNNNLMGTQKMLRRFVFLVLALNLFCVVI